MDTVRIVGGDFRGRALASPSGGSTRPTGDRVREAVFNVIAHGYRDRLDGVRVLDLFAGTGALGLEAVSRGASACVFVEEAADARGAIRTNIETFGLQGKTRILRRDATALGNVGTMMPFGLVFADPPYGKGLAERALDAARRGGWLSPDALCVVEEAAASPFQPPEGFVMDERRDYGDTCVAFCRLA